jgi:hypothetical protein
LNFVKGAFMINFSEKRMVSIRTCKTASYSFKQCFGPYVCGPLGSESVIICTDPDPSIN